MFKMTTMAKPNILFILADDLGWADVSMHGSAIRTPTCTRSGSGSNACTNQFGKRNGVMGQLIAMSVFFVLAIACTAICSEKLTGGTSENDEPVRIRSGEESSASQPPVASPTKPWKYDLDILEPPTSGSSACPMGTAGPYCDEDGRIWVPLEISFGSRSDAYIPHLAYHIMFSQDKGLSWEFTDLKYPQDWPGPRTDSVTLADGTIIEARSSGFERHPRSQIERLQKYAPRCAMVQNAPFH